MAQRRPYVRTDQANLDAEHTPVSKPVNDGEAKQNEAAEVREERATQRREDSAEARKRAFEDVKAGNRDMVDALLAERRGLQQRADGETNDAKAKQLRERVEQATEQLKLRGYKG